MFGTSAPRTCARRCVCNVIAITKMLFFASVLQKMPACVSALPAKGEVRSRVTCAVADGPKENDDVRRRHSAGVVYATWEAEARKCAAEFAVMERVCTVPGESC